MMNVIPPIVITWGGGLLATLNFISISLVAGLLSFMFVK